MENTRSIVPATDALERLKEGNRRFVEGVRLASPSWHPALAEPQRPFAVVLGCADSRAPAEYVFDQGLGDLFVVRVAGNIVAPSLIGSIEFAVDKLETRLVVVMGHSGCGAITATVDEFEREDIEPGSVNVQSIVERIAFNIRHVLRRGPLMGMATPSLIDAAVEANAIASAREIRAASPFLRELNDQGTIKIVPCVFDIGNGVVTFLEE